MTEYEILSDALAEKLNNDLHRAYSAGELDFVPDVLTPDRAVIRALYRVLCLEYDNDADAVIKALERARERLGGR